MWIPLLSTIPSRTVFIRALLFGIRCDHLEFHVPFPTVQAFRSRRLWVNPPPLSSGDGQFHDDQCVDFVHASAIGEVDATKKPAFLSARVSWYWVEARAGNAKLSRRKVLIGDTRETPVRVSWCVGSQVSSRVGILKPWRPCLRQL